MLTELHGAPGHVPLADGAAPVEGPALGLASGASRPHGSERHPC